MGRDEVDVDYVVENWPVAPGAGIDIANKLMKPVQNLWGTYRRLARDVYDGKADRVAFQASRSECPTIRPSPAGRSGNG